MSRTALLLFPCIFLAQAPTGGAHRPATSRMLAHVGVRMPRLRGGAFLQEDKRGFCEETGAWLDNYDLPHEDVRNLTVIFPRDQPHDIVIGAPSLAFCLLPEIYAVIFKLLDDASGSGFCRQRGLGRSLWDVRGLPGPAVRARSAYRERVPGRGRVAATPAHCPMGEENA